jgi:type IV pilus assembly protein PilQ
MLVTPKGKWDYSAHQTGNQFVMDLRSLDDPSLAKSDKPIYSGEKLTLNFQNVEVRAVLQVIADFTGLNIIASDTVTGNVTLRLKDVPWDQALDIIMRAKGLDKRASGSVIWIAPRDELAAKEKQELEAKKSMMELEGLVTRNYRLNYIRADEAMVVLSGGSRSASTVGGEASCSADTGTISADSIDEKDESQKIKINRVLSDRGGSAYDLTTNTLIVTDVASRHVSVENVLKEIDVPSRQVMIEARVVLADDSFGRNLGVKLGFQGSGKSGNTGLGLGLYDTSASAAVSGISNTAPNANVNLGVINPAGALGFTIFSPSSAAILSLELQALEADKRGKVVSNPRVVTTNLRPAVIRQGADIPYATVKDGATTTEFKSAVLCLLVSPQILNNDDVILNVEIKKDEIGSAVTAGQIIIVRRVQTQVRVKNGETVVLGGIFEQKTRNESDRVPVLGDLPVLGNLFKSTRKSDEKTEMLIFLTPRILQDDLLNSR